LGTLLPKSGYYFHKLKLSLLLFRIPCSSRNPRRQGEGVDECKIDIQDGSKMKRRLGQVSAIILVLVSSTVIFQTTPGCKACGMSHRQGEDVDDCKVDVQDSCKLKQVGDV